MNVEIGSYVLRDWPYAIAHAYAREDGIDLTFNPWFKLHYTQVQFDFLLSIGVIDRRF